jgi:hypothetical protein
MGRAKGRVSTLMRSGSGETTGGSSTDGTATEPLVDDAGDPLTYYRFVLPVADAPGR